MGSTNYVLNIVKSVFVYFLSVGTFIIVNLLKNNFYLPQRLLYVLRTTGAYPRIGRRRITMTERGTCIPKSKKRKQPSSESPRETITNRTKINANWQQFLSKNLNMDPKIDKPLEESNKCYSGMFRRTRKKNNISNETLLHAKSSVSTKLDSETKQTNEKVKDEKCRITKFIAMDCEMVGIGLSGTDNMLARVSLVNKFGECIYDKFVKPREPVTDYRTSVSGVRKEDLLNGENFTVVQNEVATLLHGRVLVGHSVSHDLGVLFLSHPKKNIRDTSQYKPFRKMKRGHTPSLKYLIKSILNVDIQSGEHNSVEDARATMQLYCTVAKEWEDSLSGKRGHHINFMEDLA